MFHKSGRVAAFMKWGIHGNAKTLFYQL